LALLDPQRNIWHLYYNNNDLVSRKDALDMLSGFFCQLDDPRLTATLQDDMVYVGTVEYPTTAKCGWCSVRISLKSHGLDFRMHFCRVMKTLVSRIEPVSSRKAEQITTLFASTGLGKDDHKRETAVELFACKFTQLA
jgi:hypothetical protein